MDTRTQKARMIVASGRVVCQDGAYLVPRQSGAGFYRVTLDGLFPTCGCEDHELTGGECKHIQAARLWREEREIVGPPEKAEVPEPPKRKTYK